jgi:hypothetical protein
MKEEARGPLKKSMLDSKDVFIVDASDAVFVWVGKSTSKNERTNAMLYAMVS